MKSILFDCDSTLGIPGKPMDDALALLYLLGRPQEAQVLGITCTFGNGSDIAVIRKVGGIRDGSAHRLGGREGDAAHLFAAHRGAYLQADNAADIFE